VQKYSAELTVRKLIIEVRRDLSSMAATLYTSHYFTAKIVIKIAGIECKQEFQIIHSTFTGPTDIKDGYLALLFVV
jgi:hypothetical protein